MEFLDQANQWIEDVVEDIEDWSEEGRESSQVDDVTSIEQILCCEPDEEKNGCKGDGSVSVGCQVLGRT